MRYFIFATLLCCTLAAGPATEPSSRPAAKTRYTLMHGAVRFMVPGDYTLTLRTEDDHHSQFQSPDGKCVIVVGIQEEETGFPAQDEHAVEIMKTAILGAMRKKLQERGVHILYGPRSESDSDFVLRIHTRYVDNGETYDEMQTYRARGLDLLQVLTQAKTDKPAEANAYFRTGDGMALSMILGPADKKQPPVSK